MKARPASYHYAMETQLPSQQAPFALTASNAVRPGDHVDFVYSTIALPPEIANSPEVQTLLRAPAATQFLQTRIILPNIRLEPIRACTHFNRFRVKARPASYHYAITYAVQAGPDLRHRLSGVLAGKFESDWSSEGQLAAMSGHRRGSGRSSVRLALWRVLIEALRLA